MTEGKELHQVFEMVSAIGEAAVYEGLAEEATELAQAALKYARCLRDENPLGSKLLTIDDYRERVIEEYTDLAIYIDDVNLPVDLELYRKKMARYRDRLKECEQKQGEKETTLKDINLDMVKKGLAGLSEALEKLVQS